MKYGVKERKGSFIIQLNANGYMNKNGKEQKKVKFAETFKTKAIAERTLRFWLQGILRGVNNE